MKMRMSVEAPSRPLQDRHPADAGLRVRRSAPLPGQHRVVDQPDRRVEDRRPEGEKPADLERQAHDDLAVGDIGEDAIEEMRRPVRRVARRRNRPSALDQLRGWKIARGRPKFLSIHAASAP
jgi:hypothetical protein